MKPQIENGESGGTLFVTLMICLILGVALCSTLVLSQSRAKIAMRSTAWNSAMPVLEAGLEEALVHLHDDPNTPSANGWASTNVAGHTGYWKKRTFTDGSSFFTTIYNYSSNNPTIYSAGFVPSPLANNSSDLISRLVKVNATNPPNLFNRGVSAGGQVTLSGGAVVDGYNSSQGPYNTVSNRSAAGGIATDSTASKAIDVGTAHVYGTATTGPGGTVSVGGGAVGDVNWNATSSGIEPGWTNNNMNTAFPTNPPPTATTMVPPTVTSVSGSNITYLTSATYKTSSMTSSDGTKPIIVTGNAVLWVTGNFTVSGSGFVEILPGGSLTLYIGGTGTISGDGLVNGTGVPANCSILGLSSCNTLTYSGSANYFGTMNAPEAAVTVSGGANVFGGVICGSFTSSGGSGVHYDQALGGGTGLVVTGWTEL